MPPRDDSIQGSGRWTALRRLVDRAQEEGSSESDERDALGQLYGERRLRGETQSPTRPRPSPPPRVLLSDVEGAIRAARDLPEAERGRLLAQLRELADFYDANVAGAS